MKGLGLAMALLAVIAAAAYSAWTFAWAALLNPGRAESSPAVYWGAVALLSLLTIGLFWLAVRLGRRFAKLC